MSKADEKIVAEAKKRFKRAEDFESAARILYREDLKFSEGDSDNMFQWPDDVLATRTAQQRPALTMNKIRQHVLQIVNDARQNKAAVKVSPVGGQATFEAAQMLSALVRHIEYQSQATEAYEAATNSQVRGGIGYWRIQTDYAGDDTDDQEIYIRRIANALNVYLDPEIEQFDGSDARFGFIFRDRRHDDIEAERPELATMLADKSVRKGDGWLGEDDARECEYFRAVETEETLHRLDDGSTARGDVPKGRKSLKSRPVKVRKIEWYKIVGDEIVDREDWPGQYIPIVRVVGEETTIDGKLDRKGHVRALKDAQRMYNYYTSASVEFVALQTKTPYIAPVAAIEGFEEDWASANTENKAILPYNHMDDAGREVPAPRRQEPPQAAQAYSAGMQTADNEMMQVSGQYQAELGRSGNERSGVAIQQRQRQGDNATYHYIDHLAQAIRYTGRILIDLIPHIYDTPRVVKILAEDGDTSEVEIDPQLPAAHAVVPQAGPTMPGANGGAVSLDPSGQPVSPADQMAAKVKVYLNPSIGRYSVQADVGPSYGTQRQEAFNAFSQITAQNKELMSVVGDLMFKNSDMPGADEIAQRLKRMVPQQALGGPPPEVQKLQQQLQALNQHASGMAHSADQQVADLKQQVAALQDRLKVKDGAVDNQTYDGETRRLAAIAAGDPDAFKVLIRSQLSQLLGMPALPVMQAHSLADAQHQAGMAAANQQAMPQQPAPGGDNSAQQAQPPLPQEQPTI